MTGGRLRAEDGFVGAGDDVYESLLRAHAGLTEEQSAALDARLVLLLANQVGDVRIVAEAIDAARRSVAAEVDRSGG